MHYKSKSDKEKQGGALQDVRDRERERDPEAGRERFRGGSRREMRERKSERRGEREGKTKERCDMGEHCIQLLSNGMFDYIYVMIHL